MSTPDSNQFGEIPEFEGRPEEYDPGFGHMHSDVQVGGECAFCDNMIEFVEENGKIVPLNVIARSTDDALALCESCWLSAAGGAKWEDVAQKGGVFVVYAHA